jgi:tRNA pseudouridine38-40 synthase
MNAQLPADIRIMEAHRAPDSFHARFSAKGKQYRYFVFNHVSMNPLIRQQAWQCSETGSGRDAQGGDYFKGKKDFAAFANNRNYAMETTVRTVFRCELRKAGPFLNLPHRRRRFLQDCAADCRNGSPSGNGKVQGRRHPAMLAIKDRRMDGYDSTGARPVL